MSKRLIFRSIVLQTAICLQVVAWAKNGVAESGGADLQRHYDAAQKYQLSGHLDEAAVHYRAFLAGALSQLAEAHAVAGVYARADSLFEDALALTPDDASLRLAYARAALTQGDLPRAESVSREAIDNYPGTRQQVAEAHQILGRAFLKANKDQEARSEFEKAIALDANFENGYGLAVVCLDLDDEKCANQVFHEMEAAFGDAAKIHLTFGRAYGNSDFAPQAVEEFKKAIAEDPHLQGAHYCLAAALLSLGDDAKNIPIAEEELKKELAISPRDSLTIAALGKLAVSKQEYELAETYLKKATSLDPHNPDGFLYLGQMYFDQQRFDDAELNLRKAIQLTTDVSRNRYQVQKAHFLLGRVLARQHKADAAHAEMDVARAFADKGLSNDKAELAGLLSNKATTSDGDGLSDAATSGDAVAGGAGSAARSRASALEKQLGPAIADTYDNMGAIAATGGDYAGAIGFFQNAFAWNPTLDGLDLNWGRAAFMVANFSEALAPLSRAIEAHPNDSVVRGALAMSLYMTGDYKGTLETLKRAGNDVTSMEQMQFIQADSLVKSGETVQGITQLEAMEVAHPEIEDVHRGLGEAYEAQGEGAKGIAELSKAIELNGNDAEAHYDLANAELGSGQAADAINQLEIAVRLLPSDSKFHRELARAYRLSSRTGEAEKEFAIYEKLSASSATKQVSKAVTGK